MDHLVGSFAAASLRWSKDGLKPGMGFSLKIYKPISFN
jgi:hypothetical protein